MRAPVWMRTSSVAFLLARDFFLGRGNQSSQILRKRKATAELPEALAQRSAVGRQRRAQPWTLRRGLCPSRPATPSSPRPRTRSSTPPLYSSALVESEDHEPHNYDRNFDVEAVKKEISRGWRLKCTFCGKRGATVGCDEKACSKNYHFFCAKNDYAVLQTGSNGIYNVFCQQHAPPKETQIDQPSVECLSRVFHPHHSEKTTPRQGGKRKRRRRNVSSTSLHVQPRELMPLNTPIKQMKEDGKHTVMKAAFLKKCKEVGLLNDLFEELLDKLHLVQERLMDETTSESEYEEIGTSLFDCRLFEDTVAHFHAALENKIHQFEEKQMQLKEETELLQDLKQTLCSVQENRDLSSSSTSVSSLSS
ncbi:PREDICTED: PHD finger protein 11 isoform X2 [Hipposideros armiger]|uniref:PHD finger protein 11 isoform X2 n=1 Tax=Hipposideros armiger TaxID=186990 RepID=A0A8B7RZA3_HIPAR|nr:PREDICTED: PHD finger protein 11 isoform X2 [Hipposideros armiger]